MLNALTTLPAASNSITVGDGTAVTVSGEIRLPRLTVNTWSCESTHVPATSPVTQGLGLPVAVLMATGVPNWPATGSGNFGNVGSYCSAGTLGLDGGSAWLMLHRPMPMASARVTEPAYTNGLVFISYLSSFCLVATGRCDMEHYVPAICLARMFWRFAKHGRIHVFRDKRGMRQLQNSRRTARGPRGYVPAELR